MTLVRLFAIFIISFLCSSGMCMAQNRDVTDLNKYWDQIWGKRTVMAPNPFAVDAMHYLNTKGVNSLELSLLDLGAGDGRDSVYFNANGIKVTALDVAKKSLSELKKREPNISTRAHDLNQLSLEDENFDVIYAHLSLHYFNDEKTDVIIQQIFKALKPGGVFFIKCKSTKDPLYGRGLKVDKDMYEYKHVRHFFSKEYMNKKLSRFSIHELKESSDFYEGHRSNFVEAIAVKSLT